MGTVKTARERGYPVGKWIGYIGGSMVILGGVSKCVNDAYAYDSRLKAVEIQVIPMKRVLWDMQILVGAEQSRNPARFDSLVHRQTILNGPRPEIKEMP